jgi:hypothetical protein
MARSTETLIRDLGDGLTPVRRAASPTRLALIWLGISALIAGGLAVFFDTHAAMVRLGSAADMWLAVLGSLLTAVLAAKAAFELAMPGRSRLWALLPVPALLLWIGASGMGCLRTWAATGWDGSLHMECLMVIIGVSVPLAAAMVIMLRRSFPLHPALTAMVAGLACAAAAATVLALFHPADAAAADLAFHALAVAVVTAVLTVSGRRLLKR